jgi:hypothetical protein
MSSPSTGEGGERSARVRVETADIASSPRTLASLQAEARVRSGRYPSSRDASLGLDKNIDLLADEDRAVAWLEAVDHLQHAGVDALRPLAGDERFGNT